MVVVSGTGGFLLAPFGIQCGQFFLVFPTMAYK